VLELKNVKRGRLTEYAAKYKTTCYKGKNVWDVIREQGIKEDLYKKIIDREEAIIKLLIDTRDNTKKFR
jgi:hypothetical protein